MKFRIIDFVGGDTRCAEFGFDYISGGAAQMSEMYRLNSFRFCICLSAKPIESCDLYVKRRVLGLEEMLFGS